MAHALYTAHALASGGGRDGKSATLDGALAVTLAPPKELGGSGNGNNPEQLFAVGYAACYLGAMRHAASQDKSLPVGRHRRKFRRGACPAR